ncbi:hypothetical protein [Mucilaginibacter sp.]|uniref:hypothetical protein n=1 Tax=Mucilaginibacter sp. TaxID=1882438 RepID=UPI0025CCC5BE|nr:hypothetical protein [Mucilaginibacter sp.]
MSYLGGIYISQVEGGDTNQAMDLWIENLDTNQIKGFSKSDKKKLIEVGFSDDDKDVPITGVRNVSCFCVRTKKGFAIINIIKTAEN